MTLPRKREDIIAELNEIKSDTHHMRDGRLVRAVCILAEVILDKEDYPTLDDNDLRV